MPLTNEQRLSHRHHAITEFCDQHGVRRPVTRHTIWARSHGEANDLTTLIAREWDSVYSPPQVGVMFPYPHGDEE